MLQQPLRQGTGYLYTNSLGNTPGCFHSHFPGEEINQGRHFDVTIGTFLVPDTLIQKFISELGKHHSKSTIAKLKLVSRPIFETPRLC